MCIHAHTYSHARILHDNSANVVCVEDEHPPFLSPLRDDFPFFFNEAPKMGELDLGENMWMETLL